MTTFTVIASAVLFVLAVALITECYREFLNRRSARAAQAAAAQVTALYLERCLLQRSCCGELPDSNVYRTDRGVARFTR